MQCSKLNGKIESRLSGFDKCVLNSSVCNVTFISTWPIRVFHCRVSLSNFKYWQFPVDFPVRFPLNVTMEKQTVIHFIVIPPNAVYYFRRTALIKQAGVQSYHGAFINMTLGAVMTYSFFSLAANSDLKWRCQIKEVYSTRGLWQPALETQMSVCRDLE